MKKEISKIILFNPRSADHNHRLPLSILQVAASVSGRYDYVIVDGNLEADPLKKIRKYLQSGDFNVLAVTVMPGPQLKQAYNISSFVRTNFPETVIIWGGYFPSNFTEICMDSDLIDYVVSGPGDIAFPALIDHINTSVKTDLTIKNVSYKNNYESIITNPVDEIPDQESVKPLPYDDLERFYPFSNYIVRTFLGNRTILYHSSIGCPFDCSFCGVASVYGKKWKGKPAKKMFEEIMSLKEKYQIDSIEIIDSNFFACKNRIIEFSYLMKGQCIRWWAEARIDSINTFSISELKDLHDAGCSLIFMGAETGNYDLLKESGKGGSITPDVTRKVLYALSKTGIIPQLSFVLGFPHKDPMEVHRQVKSDILFMRQLREINEKTHFILFTYSPVPSGSNHLSESVHTAGFSFPNTLEEWITPQWENFELRKGRITPWLLPETVRYIRNFEIVLNAFSPDISNFHIRIRAKSILKYFGQFRYKRQWYRFPIELRFLLKLLSYRLPEKEGFYSE